MIEWWQILLFPRGGFLHLPCTYCSERWPRGETKTYQHQWHCDFWKRALSRPLAGVLATPARASPREKNRLLDGPVLWGKREAQTSHSNRNPTSRTDSRWKDNTRSGIWHFFIPLTQVWAEYSGFHLLCSKLWTVADASSFALKLCRMLEKICRGVPSSPISKRIRKGSSFPRKSA